MTLRSIALAAAFSVAAIGTEASAQDLAEKLCIINAAARLPQVQGLEIVGSKIEPFHDTKPQEGTKTHSIEIEVRAAGINITYRFICAVGPGKPVGVSAVGAIR